MTDVVEIVRQPPTIVEVVQTGGPPGPPGAPGVIEVYEQPDQPAEPTDVGALWIDTDDTQTPFVAGLLSITVNLSAADIVDWQATPAVVVPAATGKIIVPYQAVFAYTFATKPHRTLTDNIFLIFSDPFFGGEGPLIALDRRSVGTWANTVRYTDANGWPVDQPLTAQILSEPLATDADGTAELIVNYAEMAA